jgi:PAS domain S-box-containing protein
MDVITFARSAPDCAEPQVPAAPSLPSTLRLIFVSLLLIVPLLAYVVIQLEGPRIRHEAQADLAAIAQLKAQQIETWMHERRGNARMLMTSEGFIAEAARHLADHTPAALLDDPRLQTLRQVYGYEVALLDPQDPHLDAARRILLAQALADGEPRWSDLYRDPAGQVWLDLLAPLKQPMPEGPRPLGGVLLRVRAADFLFPLIQAWPTQSPSAETLLFRREADQVLYLNELRHRPGTALRLRLPLASAELPAAIALRLGGTQSIEGRDYRGNAVLAASRPVAGTPWLIAAKIDRREVERPLHVLVGWISLVTLIAIVAVGLVLHRLWRQQQRNHQLALMASTGERDRLLNLFYDLPFMGMAIVAPDDCRFLQVNDRLCEILGYRREELLATAWEMLLPPEDRVANQSEHQRLLAGHCDAYHLEQRFLRKDGSHVDIALAVKCVRRPDGSVEHIVKTLRDITERKWSEDLLRRTQTLLYNFVEQAPLSIAMFNRNMNYLAYSRRWLEEYGQGHDDLLGRNHYKLHPDSSEAWRAVHRRGLAGETVRNDEDHWLQADGSERWLRWAVVPWRDENDEIGGIIISAEDITERKRIEQELSSSRVRLAAIIDSAMDAIITLDDARRITLFNPAAERMFGYRAEAMIGTTIDILLPERLRPIHQQHVLDFAGSDLSSASPVQARELCARRQDGSEFPIEITVSRTRIHGEQAYTAILRDVSERKASEQILRDRELDLTRAQAVGHIGSWRLDVRKNELTWSEENHRIFEAPAGTAMTYEFFLERVHPDDRAYVDREWQAALTGAPYDIEHRLLVNGRVKWVREKANLEFTDAGDLVGGFGITQDITDIKQAEQALRDSEERFQLAAEIGRSGTWDWDLVSGRVIWSRGHFEILGYRLDETTPSYESFLQRVHPEDRTRIEAVIRHCMQAHQDYAAEFRVVWPDRSVHWMGARGRFQYADDGSCQRMIGVLADITSHKLAELALREADQRKDEFLAMLAHELRNPLTPIRNAAHVLARLDIDEPRVRWAQDIIERQVSHLTHLVDDLLDVSRIASGKVVLKLRRLELADLVRQACEAVQALISSKHHRLDVDLPEQPLVLEGDPVRLLQVLQNLLNNAAKYTPDGGHIELIARARGPMLELQVRDNGMGMPPELLPRAFDLFRQGERTLDRSQGGLGIGLTLVRRLVELHGGQVEAQSPGPGRGSTFSLRLPLPADSPQPQAAVGPPAAPAATRLRVLVVDDDAVVAESMVVFLELEGHQVRSADSGHSALPLLASFRPQVVLLDIGLPGQDGYELARQIRANPAGEQVILVAVSGYGHEEALQRSRQCGFHRHLVKPVDPEVLSGLLAEIARPA